MLTQFFKPQRATSQPTDEMPAQEAKALILSGRAPTSLRVKGHLSLARERGLTALPAELQATSLDLTGCTGLTTIPSDLQVSRLVLRGCTALRTLPAGLHCYELDLRETPVTELPATLTVTFKLDLSGCTALRALPEGLKTGSLLLQGCTALTRLPEGLDTCFLDLSGCTALRSLPERAAVRIGRLTARGCSALQALPPWLTEIAQLDLRGCASLSALPEGLRVSSWIDLAETGITELPESLRGASLLWKGVPIDERILLRPETITAAEILNTDNAERRRVLLERMGYEAFMQGAEAQMLDRDTDPGGERRLLRVPLEGDEDLVCISVFCPSTGRQYLIRVPPHTRTCRKAAAWIAGFDDERDYRPLIET